MEDQSQQSQQNVIQGSVHAPGNVITPSGDPTVKTTPPSVINQAQVNSTPVIHTINSNQASISPQPPVSPPKKSRKGLILVAALLLLLLIGGGA